jgi:hypothetical protein
VSSRPPDFHNECIGPRAERIESRDFDTLTSQIRRNGDAGKTLLVKIGVEGAELESLMSTPDRVLDRIDQLAMEVHGADRATSISPEVETHISSRSSALQQSVVWRRWSPLPAWAYQVLLVNKRIGARDFTKPPPALPHPLDAPDYGLGRDCQVPLGSGLEFQHSSPTLLAGMLRFKT